MKKTILSNKIVLLFLLISLSINNLFAQGPNAPEAASFEPVDATDMVNLITGDFTYVLPLLNVPSPEGGYPLALAYHAGIAMDQQASWVGLGWNINPGAINRSINGYPDDYNSSQISEYFYDEGGQSVIHSLSVGYSYGVSVGVGISWEGNRALGGYVSIGYGTDIVGGGITLGTEGVSANIGIRHSTSGLTLGVSASSNGDFGVSAGYTNNNGEGFSIGASSTGNYSIGISQMNSNEKNLVSLGFSLSSSGIGINGGIRNKNSVGKTVSGAGIGINTSINNAVSMGDYTVKTSGWMIPIVIPTYVGVFSLSYGQQKIKYYLNNIELNYIDGPLSFYNGVASNSKWKVTCRGEDYYGSTIGCGMFVTTIYQDAVDYANSIEGSSNVPDCDCYIEEIDSYDSFMDIYEIPIENNVLVDKTNVSTNNMAFPSYDNYYVQAQGLSGNISSRLFDNGALFGPSEKENEDGFKLNYALNATTTLPVHAKFNNKPYFYFDNEISTYIEVNSANFNSNNNLNIEDYFIDFDSGIEINTSSRRKTSNFIEYFTNDEIINNYTTLKLNGFLKPNVDGVNFNRSSKPLNGIGGFKITAADGKTYHYSLPVYNHEMITRSFGIVRDNNEDPKSEQDSYFEKRQLEPYATHWLLTAVTGPGFVDKNTDGIASEGDYGYWVSFSYGKWSDSYIWKSPYGKDIMVNKDDADISTWIRGRKELYYLNSIKTRTHTAFFVKSKSDNEGSFEWSYKSVLQEVVGQNSNNFIERFKVPYHNSLKLDKIILLKNVDANEISSYNINDPQNKTVYIDYNEAGYNGVLSNYESYSNIINSTDLSNEIENKALKIINFNYGNLVNGMPKTALNYVDFKGKTGIQTIPPYKFSYHNNPLQFDINKKDEWGYHGDDNKYWSLNKITTPQGTDILINYEPNVVIPVMNHKFIFSNYTQGIYTSTYPTYNSITDVSNKKIEISSGTPISLNIGDNVDIKYNSSYPPLNSSGVQGSYNGSGTVTAVLGNNKYEITFDQDITLVYAGTATNEELIESLLNSPEWYKYEKRYRSTEVTYNTNGKTLQLGGIRISSININDGINNYSTEYNYGENENGIGYVSYLPYAHELEEEVPYSSELPSSRIMYEYVTIESKGTDDISYGKTQYKFNVLKDKYVDQIKFGDFYEIITEIEPSFENTTANKQVDIARFTVKDNLASIGQLLEVTSFNSENQILNKTVNEYYDLGEVSNDYGTTQEAYQTYKEVDYTDPLVKDKWIINSSKRIKYPSVLKTTSSFSNGFRNESSFTQFNPTTGQSNEILTTDSKGYVYKTKFVPAYTKYSEMGSKVDNGNYKNMLNQEAASYTFLLDENMNENVIGVGITTWKNYDYNITHQTGNPPNQIPLIEPVSIWRKYKSFIWKGILENNDNAKLGVYKDFDIATDDGFDWTIDAIQTNTKWENINTITRYNDYSFPLEIKDMNDNYVSTKKCGNDSKVMATSNAKYTEMYYSGAEFLNVNQAYFDGEVKATGRIEDANAHTGKYIVSIGVGENAFEVQVPENLERVGSKEKFKISVWTRKEMENNAKIKVGGLNFDFSHNETIAAGDWVLLNGYINIPTAQATIAIISISGNLELDDFRLLPIASTMTSYIYNEWDELSYILGANNMATHYKYDDAGRLCKIYTEVADTQTIVGGFKLIKQNKYNYINFQPENCQCCDAEEEIDYKAFAINDSELVTYLGVKTFDVTSNDNFGGDGPSTGTISLITPPTQGIANINDNNTPNDPTDDQIDYTPSLSFNGIDILTYEICDADGDCDTATVTITINLPINNVYFDNILFDGVLGRSTARLYGIPGSTITYTASNDNRFALYPNDDDTGEGIVIIDNGSPLYLYNNITVTNTILIPTVGYVNCSIEHSDATNEFTATKLYIDSASEGSIDSNMLEFIRCEEGICIPI